MKRESVTLPTEVLIDTEVYIDKFHAYSSAELCSPSSFDYGQFIIDEKIATQKYANETGGTLEKCISRAEMSFSRKLHISLDLGSPAQ